MIGPSYPSEDERISIGLTDSPSFYRFFYVSFDFFDWMEDFPLFI